MGSSSSKRSGPSDAGSNLLWSLEQLAQWEERITEDEQFLQEQLNRGSMSSQFGSGGSSFNKGESRSFREKSEVPFRSREFGSATEQPIYTKSSVDQPSTFSKSEIQPATASSVHHPSTIGGRASTDTAGQERQKATSFFIPSAETEARQGDVLMPAGGSSITQRPIPTDTQERTHLATDESMYGRYAPENRGVSTAAGITGGIIGPRATATTATTGPAATTSGGSGTGIFGQSSGATTSSSSTGGIGHGFAPTTSGNTQERSHLAADESLYGRSSSSSVLPTSSSQFQQSGSTGGIVPPSSSMMRKEHGGESFSSTSTQPSSVSSTMRPAERMGEAQSMSGSGVSSGVSGRGSDVESMRYDDNIFLPQKFHFAYEALQRLVAGAERNFRILCRMNLLRDRSKNEKQPLNKLAYDKKIDILNMQLDDGLVGWDNACEACEWLRKDYDLALHWVKLSHRMQEIQSERASLFSQRMPTSSYENLSEEDRKMRLASDGELRNKSNFLLGQTNDVRKHLNELTQEIAAHQRQSLSIGLLYLDKNKSGSNRAGALEAEDIPNMNTEIFAALDMGHRHSVSTKELQDSVDKLLGEVTTGEKELRDLENEVSNLKEEEQQRELQFQSSNPPRNTTDVEKLQADILKKQERYSLLFNENQRKRRVLDQIYHVFGQAFIKQVLKRIEAPKDEVVGKMNELIASKQKEDHGQQENFTVNRQWQPPVDV